MSVRLGRLWLNHKGKVAAGAAVVISAILMILPHGPAAGILGTDAGMYTDAGVLVQDIRDSGTYCTLVDGGLNWLGPDTLCIEAAGIRHEGPSANFILNPKSIGGTGWSSGSGGGLAAPTISLNDATCGAAPDGTLTASKITFPASTTAEQYSMVWRSDGSAKIGSYYAWNPSGSSTFYGCRFNTPASYESCAIGPLPTRCTNRCLGDSCQFFFLGTDTRATACNEPTMGAQTVCLWGAQDEPKFQGIDFPTSFMPSSDTTVFARAGDTITTTNTLPDAGVWCAGATFTPMGTSWFTRNDAVPQYMVANFPGNADPLFRGWAIDVLALDDGTAGGFDAFAIDGTGHNFDAQTDSPVSFGPHRYVWGMNGTSWVLLVDGSAPSASGGGIGYSGNLGTQLSPLYLGENAWGWFSNIRADSDVNACK